MLARPSRGSSPFARPRTGRAVADRRSALLGLCGILSARAITAGAVVGVRGW